MSDEQRIYRYVVAYDGGTAPRPFDGLCSLAICKPRIRATATEGDWIVGFRSGHPGKVVYAMQVTERMGLGDYWEDPRFRNRRPNAGAFPDNFYSYDEFGQLHWEPNEVHQSSQKTKDCSGLHVLLSKLFWYFGDQSPQLPEHLGHLVHRTQGHVVHKHRQPGDVRELRAWLAQWTPGRIGNPIDAATDHFPEPEPANSAIQPDVGHAAGTRTKRAAGSCVPQAARRRRAS